MTKRLIFILFFIIKALESSSQVPWDFAYSDEKEDSISALAIKPLAKPEKLLKQIIQRLELDLQQKHKVRKYKVEATFWQETLVPFSFGCSLSAEAGVGLEKVELDEFWYEGPYDLNNQDTIQLKDFLRQFATLSPVHAHRVYSGNNAASPLLKYRDTRNMYDVKAFDIDDASGRGVYRFQFIWKKGQPRDIFERAFNKGEITGTAYFDHSSLRLKDFKGEAHFLTKYDTRIRYQIDYYKNTKTPILRQIKIAGTRDDMIMQATVKPVL